MEKGERESTAPQTFKDMLGTSGPVTHSLSSLGTKLPITSQDAMRKYGKILPRYLRQELRQVQMVYYLGK